MAMGTSAGGQTWDASEAMDLIRVLDRSAQLHVRVLNQAGAVEPLRQCVLDFLRPHGLAERALFRLELVLEELLMNAVLHAHQDQQPHLVDLELALRDGDIHLRVSDDGLPFDPTAAIIPERPRRLADANPGGLGVKLIRHYAETMSFRRENGRNVLTLTLGRD